MESDIGSKILSRFMITTFSIGALLLGEQLYLEHSSNKLYQESLRKAKAETALVQQGRMERLYHISQSKGFDFVPSVELETNKYDRMEAIYRLQSQRGF